MDYPRIFRDNSPQSNDVISDVYNYNVKSEPGVTNQVVFFIFILLIFVSPKQILNDFCKISFRV